MDKTLKVLAAVACVAVIAVAAVWYSDRQAAADRAAKMKEFADADTGGTYQTACQYAVQTWDSGDASYAESRFGEDAARSVENCRKILGFSKLPKP